MSKPNKWMALSEYCVFVLTCIFTSMRTIIQWLKHCCTIHSVCCTQQYNLAEFVQIRFMHPCTVYTMWNCTHPVYTPYSIYCTLEWIVCYTFWQILLPVWFIVRCVLYQHKSQKNLSPFQFRRHCAPKSDEICQKIIHPTVHILCYIVVEIKKNDRFNVI